MERRYILFVFLSFAILVGYFFLTAWLAPPQPVPPAPKQAAQAPKEPNEPEAKHGEGQKQPGPKGGQQGNAVAPQPPPAETETPEIAPVPAAAPPQTVMLGSLDPSDPYRMLVTLTNRGAAVSRIELNSPRHNDLDDRSGFLGYVTGDDGAVGEGCKVEFVGPGSPADKAGLRPGDLITAVGQQKVVSGTTLTSALTKTKPGEVVGLSVLRNGKPLALQATLIRHPLEIIRPEDKSHLSMLLTLARLDKQELSPSENTVDVGKELKGIDLWTANWEVVSADRTQARFRRVLAGSGLEVIKTYRLARLPQEAIGDPNYKAYHLEMEVEIRNGGDKAHTVAYQLDGANGLPAEGAWFASKVSRSWGGAGLRDVVVSFDGQTPSMVNCPKISSADVEKPWRGESLTYIGDDAQYFSVVTIPQKKTPGEVWHALSYPLRIGKPDEENSRLTNTSYRVVSQSHELAPGEGFSHQYTVFAGPKEPKLLAQYGLGELVYYGWSIFAWPAVILSDILHLFYAVVFNYGLAIILLTVLVRAAMFPISRKQALGAQKMQLIQPELKKLQEKYKNNLEARTKAQQELFRKHNYNPLSGCLVMFIQLPIFIGLYRALMVDVSLRQAPLFSEAIRWCSNLAAPDMLFNWSGFMPEWVNSGIGIFGLGPYFNLLPLLTVVLFIGQQKMFMPPPADENAAMQQKIMKYMMVFMGVLFFKVSSGLCLYFIASSLWGMGERKLLPKVTHQPAESEPQTRADAKAEARRLAEMTKKSNNQSAAKDRDGAAAARRKARGGRR